MADHGLAHGNLIRLACERFSAGADSSFLPKEYQHTTTVSDGSDRGAVGWDEHTYYIQHVRNFTSKRIELEIRRVFPGHIVFRNGLGAVLHDYQTVQVTATIDAGQRAELRYEVVQHMGRNAKQANVKIVDVR